MARQAADQGAMTILVHPPISFRDHSHRDGLVLQYHARIAEIGLPLLAFYLYGAAGGINYPQSVWGESPIGRGDLDSQSSQAGDQTGSVGI